MNLLTFSFEEKLFITYSSKRPLKFKHVDLYYSDACLVIRFAIFAYKSVRKALLVINISNSVYCFTVSNLTSSSSTIYYFSYSAICSSSGTIDYSSIATSSPYCTLKEINDGCDNTLLVSDFRSN